MYIDTHCHLTFEQYKEDLAGVLGNAKKAGVKQFICPGVDELSSQLTVELAKKYPGVVFAAVGYHPYEASHNPDINYLEKLLFHPPSRSQSPPGRWPKDSFQVNPVVAIGECGLDYHLYKGEQALGKKQEQKMLFEEQLSLAAKHNLPVIMHCRDAFDDFFGVLDALSTKPRGVIHCFSGGLQELRQAQERDLLVGIDGNVTYSKQLAAIVPHIPLTMLMLETDSPYLTPVPHRGTRNEPKYIPLIAKKIAGLQRKTAFEIEEVATANAKLLFSI